MNIGAAQVINVKCRAMYARLLDRREYDLLISMKSVSQIAEYLMKQTPYAYALRDIDENDVHRGRLEQCFKRSLFYDYESLLKFTAGGYKAVINAMFESNEIDDIKLVVSSICSDNEHMLTPEDLEYTRSYGKISVASLLGADTMEALAGNLSGTRYYKPLLPFAVRENPDFLKIDNALNILDYKTKTEVFNKSLRGPGRKILSLIYGIKTDIENILFIYRIKKLYRYTTGEIMRYLIPCEYWIGQKDLLSFAECDSLDEIAEKIERTKYGFLFPKDREHEWETLHTEFFYRIYKNILRRNGSSIGVALSYLYLKETDMKNIVMIVEGVRYSLRPDMIASFIIGYRQPPGGIRNAAARLLDAGPAA